MTRLDHLNLAHAHVEHPDRWARAEPLRSHILVDGYEFIVRADGSDCAHVAELTTFWDGEPYGTCSCKGYGYNDGPCSHLCAIWRAWSERLVELPRYVPVSVEANPILPDEERADAQNDEDRN